MNGTVLLLAKQDTEVKPDDSQAKGITVIEHIKRKEEVCVCVCGGWGIECVGRI